ncbi:unnamed protein product [Miscanthus lutarioriparius]|uniref:Germin-like protein n=1 Tax=Miscanthus lutarioriparius TaxID=422564 RepID=A0A811RZV8_9POAL|nr:unnamed protein product [Miscanthus lutarioriparius]
MVSALLMVFTAVVALAAGHGAAFDPNPLQDFCVADSTSKVDHPGGTASRRCGFTALPVQIPGLNTLGGSHARVDVAPGAVFPAALPPAGVGDGLDGAVYFGFITSYPDNKLFAKVLRRGDVFAVPEGLVHFLYNNGTAPAALYATLSSQNPGLVLLGDALFGSGLADDLLAKTFLTDRETVDKIGLKFRS